MMSSGELYEALQHLLRQTPDGGEELPTFPKQLDDLVHQQLLHQAEKMEQLIG
jgi:hypothetical protein